MCAAVSRNRAPGVDAKGSGSSSLELIAQDFRFKKLGFLGGLGFRA